MNANPITNIGRFPVQAGDLSLEAIEDVATDFFSHLGERTRRTYVQGLQDFARFAGESNLNQALFRFLQFQPVEAYRLALQYQTDIETERTRSGNHQHPFNSLESTRPLHAGHGNDYLGAED